MPNPRSWLAGLATATTVCVCVALCPSVADPPPGPLPEVQPLASIGVSAEALAAAGFTAQEAGDLAATAAAHAGDLAALEAARALAVSLGHSLIVAQEQAAARPADTQALADLAGLQSQFAAAESQAAALTTDLWGELFSEVPPAKAARVGDFIAASRYRVEPSMRVATLPEEDWSTLELALRAEERAGALGEPLDQEHAQVLATIRSRQDVIEAAQGLALTLESIRQALATE